MRGSQLALAGCLLGLALPLLSAPLPRVAAGTTRGGCSSLQLTANLPRPLYQGESFVATANSNCSRPVRFQLQQLRPAPTRRSPSRWSRTLPAGLARFSWSESTIGLRPGKYRYRAVLRAQGSRRTLGSSSLQFVIPRPIETGNPSHDDLGLAHRLSNACQEETGTCERVSLQVLDKARAEEHLPAMVLPANFWSLPYDDQSLIVVNEERTARNLEPFLGVTATLNDYALAGAVQDGDPTDPKTSYNYSSNWTDGLGNALMDDFGYMYDDGWAGSKSATSNLDCKHRGSSGCWGHREDILVNWSIPPTGSGPLAMGAACAAQHNKVLDGWPESCAEIFTNNRGSGPLLYTWTQAVADGA